MVPPNGIDETSTGTETEALTPSRDYRLSGPQVEPESSYWNRCPLPRPITLEELTARTDDLKSPDFFPPFPSDPAVVRGEFDELLDLQRRRDDPTQVVSTEPGRERLPISLFSQLRPPPLRGGGIVNMAREDSFPVFFTGSELARFFENNTPGLAHRHALNYLIHDTNWSPPRQALVWAALDITIYSALNAAWYYKWLSPREDVVRRQRPIEYAIDRGLANLGGEDRPDRLTVLYDRAPNTTGSGSNGLRPDFPPVSAPFIPNSPGTPRHPAYPSGHSTYGAAASELLSFFFPDYRRELDFLADNTGIARLWAGIHWRSDHVAGMQLGRTVACLVIEQLRRIGIPLIPPRRSPKETPPPRTLLQQQADKFAAACGKAAPSAAPDLRRPVSTPCVSPGEGSDATAPDASDTRGESFVG
jgi:membrane-associated phospholipid phosphatase